MPYCDITCNCIACRKATPNDSVSNDLRQNYSKSDVLLFGGTTSFHCNGEVFPMGEFSATCTNSDNVVQCSPDSEVDTYAIREQGIYNIMSCRVAITVKLTLVKHNCIQSCM